MADAAPSTLRRNSVTIYCDATRDIQRACQSAGLTESRKGIGPRPAGRVIGNVSLGDLVPSGLRLPAGRSILPRISGAMMFVLLPLCLWLFDLSLRSETSYRQMRDFADGWFAKIVLAALVWALVHHLLAGIRYLSLDLDLGVELAAARRSGWIVFALSVPLATAFALMLFGAL